MAYLKTILTIQDRKTFWVLKIIDLQQGKHSLNHHTGVKSKEQIVGIEENMMNKMQSQDIIGRCDLSPSLRHISDQHH